jgi:hypothetical protein
VVEIFLRQISDYRLRLIIDKETFARVIEVVQDAQFAMISRVSRTFDKVKHTIFS